MRQEGGTSGVCVYLAAAAGVARCPMDGLLSTQTPVLESDIPRAITDGCIVRYRAHRRGGRTSWYEDTLSHTVSAS